MTNWFQDTLPIDMHDIIGVPISISEVVFDEKEHGEYAVFKAIQFCVGQRGDTEIQSISFITGAGAILGAIKKMMSQHGIRLDYQDIYKLPDAWDVTFIEKISKDGKRYIDYK